MIKFTNYAVRLGMEVCNKRTGIKDDANMKKGDYVGRLPFYVAFN